MNLMHNRAEAQCQRALKQAVGVKKHTLFIGTTNIYIAHCSFTEIYVYAILWIKKYKKQFTREFLQHSDEMMLIHLKWESFY